MKIRSMKKVLSGIIVASYLMVYTAPVGLCLATNIPENNNVKANVQINKPVLRETSKSSFVKLEGDVVLSKRNPKVSLSLRDSDVTQVLRMLADKAGMNIIFHNSVSSSSGSTASAATNNSAQPSSSSTDNASSSASSSSSSNSANSSSNNSSSASSSDTNSNKITLDLVNVPLNEAFKMITQVSGLTYFIEDNTIIVASAQAAKNLNITKQEMMIIPVKYIDAGVLADFLNKNVFSINKPGLSNSKIVITDPSTNSLLIFGTKNDYLIARKIVAQFDQKPLEETFVVNHTTPKEMADLLCNVLFKDKSGTGANNSSSSSSSSSSSTISLGSGVQACTYKNVVNADSLSSLNKNSLIITYFPQKGTINAAGGSSQQMAMIRDFIKENDKKQPQAYLELSIIELNETGQREFDNNWQVWSKFFSGTFNGTTSTNSLYPTFIKGEGYSVTDAKASDPTKILYSITKYPGTPMITYAMNYLIKNNKGKVLANPRIIITNGQTSTIDLSSDYVKSITSQVITSNGTTGATQTTYNIGSDEGIKVSLIPFISPEGYVTLNIQPTYSTIKEKVYSESTSGSTTTKDLAATLLQRRNLDLKNIRIKDGETLVIGGMIQETDTKEVSKIPLLGDLPGVGMFFRNTSTEKDKAELIIMITPKIIKDEEDVVNNQNTTL